MRLGKVSSPAALQGHARLQIPATCRPGLGPEGWQRSSSGEQTGLAGLPPGSLPDVQSQHREAAPFSKTQDTNWADLLLFF